MHLYRITDILVPILLVHSHDDMKLKNRKLTF